MSEMVGEFPDLQGIMGRYYAHHRGEHKDVCIALDEYYLPRYSGDKTTQNSVALVLAIADRIDTLCGIFAIGSQPSGDKDPFALRRAVNGIVRIVTEYDLTFNIDDIITLLKGNYNEFNTNLLSEFIIERINKSLDANPSVIASVLASGERDINEMVWTSG